MMRTFKHNRCTLVLRQIDKAEADPRFGQFQFVVESITDRLSITLTDDLSSIPLRNGDVIHFDGSPLRWLNSHDFEEVNDAELEQRHD